MRFQHFIRALILAIFAAFIIKLHYTGEIMSYINPRYTLMSKIAIAIFLFLFLIQLVRIWENRNHTHNHCSSGCHHDHDHSGSFSKRFIVHLIILFPLVTGFAFAPATLDASIAAKKGLMLPQVNEGTASMGEHLNRMGEATDEKSAESIEPPANKDDSIIQHTAPLANTNYLSKEQFDKEMEKLTTSDIIQMNDNIYASYYSRITEDPASYIGKKIKVSGFFYKEDGFEENQFVLARFLMTHCVADTSVIGMLVEFNEANDYQEDTWLEIEGEINVTNYNGHVMPFIKVDKLKVIDEPSEPYVYPAMIKIV
ncbi:TIGR03943 family putative permease subunit [Oceanobacillus neutriphilus]|uniref:TIGR03943 family protein n=1 Tax=Oceanobacillus neutriphilus TaxID=531815 RepID=A0ABQ2NPR5_9BACI|nr:TIGR03943 family protein [Oceanobacillus neutriphilus]GGP08671.1 TIGR03943 family protein [Oceanobacillus neutriphilus]